MRIIQITTVHKPFDNRIYHKECVSLFKAGHKVSLMACKTVDIPFDLDVDIIELPKYLNRKKHFLFTSVLGVIRKARELKADVYHIHDPELLIAGLYLRLLGYIVIYDTHENNPASILSKPYLSGKFKRKFISILFDKFELFAASKMSAIVTATDDIAVRFKKFKPTVIRNFPIAPDFSTITTPEKKKTKDVVIFVGGMTRIRGIKELITAFNDLDNVELWLLGGFESEDFENECKLIPGWKNVDYLGSVPPTEIYGYIKMADVGVVTYLPYPNHVTALPTKAFEYMAGGIPMLMSNFDYWKELFGDIAHFADPAKPKEIAAVIREMLLDKIKLEAIHKRSLELIENEFSWQIEEERLLSLYDRFDVK